MKNKKRLTGCFAVLAFSALALGVAGMNVATAQAAEETAEAKKNGFYMEAGASVRVDGKAGVRYSAYLSADKYAELITQPEEAGKDVKIYAVVNRADTGTALDAQNAVRQEISLPVPDENGGYTLLARVTYDELKNGGLLEKASAVEISARYYIVTDGDDTSAVAAEENDNARSMRAVANAAVLSGEVKAEEVKNYLGTITNASSAGKMYAADKKTIDLSGVIGNDSAFDTAYFGAAKAGTVENNKVTLDTAFTAEIGEEIPLTLMDASNNVLNASFVYGYTTISGTVQGANGTVTAAGTRGEKFTGEIIDNAYFADVLANDTYNLYFDCGSGATATDGILNGVTVDIEAVTGLNLDKTYAKVATLKHGDGAIDPYGDWTRTANDEYTANLLADGNSYTLGAFAEAEDFYVSARIRGGKGKFVGMGLDVVGDNFGDSSANKNLQFFQIAENDYWVQLYSWGPGGWQSGSNAGLMIEKNGGTADDFVFTLIRYEKAFHVFINGEYVNTWQGTITDSGRNIDLTKIGTVIPGMLLRGNKGSGNVTFSDWEYISDKSAVAEKLALGSISGTVAGADGTVTATLVENGAATNVKYSAKITNKAYSLTLTAGKTYNLYFNCGTTDGVIFGATATKDGFTANLDKTYAKVTVATPGGCGTAAGQRGSWTRTANNEYTVEGLHDGNAFTVGQLVASDKFVVRMRIKGASNMQAGVTLLTNDATKNLQIFRNGNDSEKKFTMYSWEAGWVKSEFVADGVEYDANDFTMTIIWYNKELRLYINDVFSASFSGTVIPVAPGSVKSIDFDTLGSMTVGMSLRGIYPKTVKFCDWSFSATESDITDYISAHKGEES